MILYSFIFDERPSIHFQVDEQGTPSPAIAAEPIPAWLDLERFRCAACTLAPGGACPAALAIQPVVEAFASAVSYETVLLRVKNGDHVLEVSTTTQRAIRSLLGLLLPLSTCPVLRMLRPMARFHQPLGTPEHTAFRFLGMHLVAQYLRHDAGLNTDWGLDGLSVLLERIHLVNRQLVARLRHTAQKDAALNSLIILDALAEVVEDSIETQLDELRPLFAAYPDEGD